VYHLLRIPGKRLIMVFTTNAGVASHVSSHGLTRMPAFANLASVTHFQRTKACVSGRSLSASVSSSFATRGSPYGQSSDEGRASSPTLPIVQSRRPAQTTTDVKLVDSSRTLLATESLSTHHSSLSSRSGSASSSAHETSNATDKANPRDHSPSTTNVRLTSAINADFPHRRTHAIVFGKLIPVVFRSGRSGSLVSDDKVPAPQQNTFTIATIAAGARPMLYTAQGFPFDMRRSRVEAGRVEGAPLESL
jgi:hypothetical protein